jgi:hypothetical protein
MDWCTLHGLVVDKAGHVYVAFVRADHGLEAWILDDSGALPIEVRPPCRLVEEPALLDWLYETADAMGNDLPKVVVSRLSDVPAASQVESEPGPE